MIELWIITRASLANQFGLNRFFKQQRPPALKLLMGGVTLSLAGGGIFWLMWSYAQYMGALLQPYGMLSLLLLQGFLLASMVCFVAGIYSAPGQLLFCTDYELLFSLPLRPATVLLSKLLSLWLMDCLYSSLLALPPLLVYGQKCGAGPLYYANALLMVPCIPLLPLTVASLFALLTARLVVRLKHNRGLLTCLTFGGLTGMMGAYLWMAHSSKMVAANATTILSHVQQGYPPARFFIDALRGPSLGAMLLYDGLSLGIFCLLGLGLGRFFKSLHSRLTASVAHAGYTLKALASGSALRALFLKELRGYISCPIYVLNTFFGMVMLTLFSLSLQWMSEPAKVRLLLQVVGSGAMALSALMVAVFCTIITCTTASSISLEGPSLWILKNAPLEPRLIFKAKLLLNLALTWPVLLLDSLLLARGLHLGPSQWLLIWSVSCIYALFIALMGLWLNLLFPKLQFKNPSAVVKQSASALLSFALGLASLAIPIALFVWLHPQRLGAQGFALVVAGLLLGLSALLWQVLRTRGVAWFRGLQ